MEAEIGREARLAREKNSLGAEAAGPAAAKPVMAAMIAMENFILMVELVDRNCRKSKEDTWQSMYKECKSLKEVAKVGCFKQTKD